ncbi:MAG: hypothetical protein PHF10_04320 [Patescibacteria group bacterium]|nr:hypothetical protein [Patescibacteria group bacterium]
MILYEERRKKMGKKKNYYFKIKTVVNGCDTIIFHIDTRPHLKEKGKCLTVTAHDKKESISILKGETGKVHGGIISL